MKKTLLVLLLLFCIIGAIAQVPNALLPEAKVTIKVLDEAGSPVSAADVVVGFEYNKGSGVGSQELKGRTDAKGTYSASGKTSGYVTYVASKAGYYRTTGQPFVTSEKDAGQWKPYNPTLSIVVKKITNPIPMYARQSLETDIPKGEQPVGFDLVVSDWVAPFGKGKSGDLLFKVDARVASWKDYASSLQITFPNPGDGIIAVPANPKYGSELRLPRLAPEGAYKPDLILRRGRMPGAPGAADQMVNNLREDQNYFIRVRTVLDEKGKVVSAQYGKIHGDFDFDPRESKGAAFLRFTYYMNPHENDRNVEFDPARNLFTGLKSSEEVNLP